MNTKRWHKLDEIFDAALELDAGGRAALLSARCAGDTVLWREIEGLLKAHDEAGDFIETPAMKLAAQAAANETRAGRRIGHYQVISLLGAGGMGEVYLAEDTRLKRKVALKFLPPAFSADSERVRRFAHEAQAASALNHPNIITIYDIGEVDGTPYIATEYVAGRTLRTRLQAGRMSLKDALPVVEQVAAALSAAHAAGIVHRDIKPENVMLRPDGYVKVLDFGLAKLLEPGPVGTDTVSLHGDTQTGPLMGTLNYMSPEQALGEKVDARADIWSLGVVLYEMLTGRKPFQGATPAATFKAIFNHAPSAPSEIVTGLPAGCDEVVSRALEKERDLRYQTAADLRAGLKRLERGFNRASWPKAMAARATTRPSNLWPALLAGLVAFCALAVWLFFPAAKGEIKREGPDWSRAASTQLTHQAGGEFHVNLAPDGKSYIYASRANGSWDIYWQRVGGRNAANLTKNSPADDTQPAYSPDGKYIAFRSERAPAGIYVMEATGENARRVADTGFNPAWSPDGKELAVGTDFFTAPVTRSTIPSQLWVINVASGEKRLLSQGDAVQPAWSPNGKRVAYWALQGGNSGQRDIWTMPAEGGPPVPVTNDAALDWNPVWSPDGQFLYFASNRGGSMNFWRVRLDENTGAALAPPEAVVTPSSYSQHLSFSRDGKHLAYVQKSETSNLQRIAFDPATGRTAGDPQPVTQGARYVASPNLSPDDEWFVYSSQGETQEDLWLLKRDGAEQRQLTNDAAHDRAPRWSPDGQRIAFYSDRSGRFEVWLINADGTGLRQITFTQGPPTFYPLWSPDGARLLYKQREAQPAIIETARPWAEQTPVALPLIAGRGADFWPSAWSPDGGKLAGSWVMKPLRHHNLHIYDFATDSYENLGIAGTRPVWLNDQRRLLYLRDGKLRLADINAKQTREVLSPTPYSIGTACPARDNRTLYYSLQKTEADIWLWSLE